MCLGLVQYNQDHLVSFSSDLSLCSEYVGNVASQLLFHHMWFNLLNNNKNYEPVSNRSEAFILKKKGGIAVIITHKMKAHS